MFFFFLARLLPFSLSPPLEREKIDCIGSLSSLSTLSTHSSSIHRTVLTLLLASTSLPSSSVKAASSRASGGPVASICVPFFLRRRVFSFFLAEEVLCRPLPFSPLFSHFQSRRRRSKNFFLHSLRSSSSSPSSFSSSPLPCSPPAPGQPRRACGPTRRRRSRGGQERHRPAADSRAVAATAATITASRTRASPSTSRHGGTARSGPGWRA